MILGIVLPDAVTPRHVATLAQWLRERGQKLRPWLETYAAAEAAREGIEVEEGTVPAIFDYVLRALDALLAWPSMDPATIRAAHEWYEEQSHE